MPFMETAGFPWKSFTQWLKFGGTLSKGRGVTWKINITSTKKIHAAPFLQEMRTKQVRFSWAKKEL